MSISSGFYHNRKKLFDESFTHFQTSHIENHRKRTNVCNFSRIIFKRDKGIYCPTISDEFDYRGFASLNMRMVGRLMNQSILIFLFSEQYHQSWYKCRPKDFSINISSRFYHDCNEFDEFLLPNFSLSETDNPHHLIDIPGDDRHCLLFSRLFFNKCIMILHTNPGPLFTKETPSYQYMDSHYKHETVVRPS